MTKSIYVCAAALSAVLSFPLVHDVPLRAQASSSPAFEVVSIKRNVGGAGMMMRTVAGNVSTSNVPVIQLIRQAYALQEFQAVGGPDWVRTDGFDMEARFDPVAGAPLTGPALVQAMLKNMLSERFKLTTHTERRDMPILALVLARADKTLGPQLRPSTVDCAALMASRRGGPPPDGRRGGGAGLAARGGAAPDGTAPIGERPQCGGRGGFGRMVAGGLTMAQFATQLAQLNRQVVVDRTGLTGGYDFDLTWTPTPDQLPPGAPPRDAAPADPNGPSLFAALEEQLGLKLESGRAPVEVLVIDRIEPPTEN